MIPEKKSFVMYYKDWDMIGDLNHEQLANFVIAIFSLGVEGLELPDLDPMTNLVFKMARNQIERDSEKYDQVRRKRSAAGKKGADARWGTSESNGNAINAMANDGKAISDVSKMAVSVSVSDSVAEAEADADAEAEAVSVSGSVSESTDRLKDQTDEGARLIWCGALRNVKLTKSQYDEVMETYVEAEVLIDRVSRWLKEKAEKPHQNHYKLIQTFAENDNFAKRSKPKKAAQVVEAPPEVTEPEPEPETYEYYITPRGRVMFKTKLLGGSNKKDHFPDPDFRNNETFWHWCWRIAGLPCGEDGDMLEDELLDGGIFDGYMARWLENEAKLACITVDEAKTLWEWFDNELCGKETLLLRMPGEPIFRVLLSEKIRREK